LVGIAKETRAIITLPGYFQLPLPRVTSKILSPFSEGSPPFNTLLKLFNFIEALYNLYRSQTHLLTQRTRYFQPSSPISHLLGLDDHMYFTSFLRNPSRLTSICRLACLIWLSATFLEHAHSPGKLDTEFAELHARLLKHRLDSSRSIVMLCELLLTKYDCLEMHNRAWLVVRIMNALKEWHSVRLDDFTRLLRTLLAFTNPTEVANQHYERVMEEIKFDMLRKYESCMKASARQGPASWSSFGQASIDSAHT
jgi:hypothetical protein